MTPDLTSVPRWAVFCGYVGGLLLALVPALVELVAGDFFLLLPVGLVLALAVVRPLRGSTEHRVFAALLAAAVLVELAEQLLFPDDVPVWADVAPPLFFTLTGIALVLTAREAAGRR